jgi:hypothetical protein
MRLTKLWQIVLVIGITLPGFALGQEDAAEAEPEGAVEAPADPAAAPKDSPAGEASSAAPTTGPKPASGSPTDPKSETKAEGGAMDGSTYVVRLRDLETRVDELKEQIRRSHTRLSLLSDTILSGGVGGARAEIRFENDLSSAFRLTRALFVLDGAVQYNKQDDTGELASQKEIPIFSGAIPPGDHTLQVLLKLKGHGYGVFSYLRGYQFEVKSSHSFTVTEGKTIELEAVAWEQGGVTTPLEQRPAVRYTSKIRSGLTGGQPASKPDSSKDGKGSGKVSTELSVGTGAK